MLSAIAIGEVSGYDTVEVAIAAYRQASHDRAVFLAALAETGLRAAGSARTVRRLDCPGEFASEEARAALVWSRRRAETTYEFAWDIHHRLPLLGQAMLAGELDEPRALAFCQWTAGLTEEHAAAVCIRLLPQAPTLLVGELIDRIKRLAIALDPQWAERRYRRAVKGRRVIANRNSDGTVNITGADLPIDRAAAASDHIDVLARACKRAGDRRPINYVRADLFLGMLDGTFETLTDRQIVAHVLAHPFSEPGEGEDETGNGPGGGIHPVDDGPGGDQANANHPDDAHPNTDHPDDAHPNTNHPDDARPNTNHPEDARPNTNHPEDDCPNTNHPEDDCPNADPIGRDQLNADDAGISDSVDHSPEASSPGEDGRAKTAGSYATGRVWSHGDEDPANHSRRAADDPVDAGDTLASEVDDHRVRPTGCGCGDEERDAVGPVGHHCDDEKDDWTLEVLPASDAGYESIGHVGPDRAVQRDSAGCSDASDPGISNLDPAFANHNHAARDPVPAGGRSEGRADNQPSAVERKGWTPRELRLALSTLLGWDDHLCELPGWDYIPAALARHMVLTMLAGQWRWVLCDEEGYPIACGLTAARPCPPSQRPPRDARCGIVEVHLTVSDLARLAEDPSAHGRYEPLTADLVARLGTNPNAGAPGAQRLTAPAEDLRRRTPRAALRRAVQIRDRCCIHPACRAPASGTDQDHGVDYARGGVTDEHNLGCCCRHDHRLRHEGGWTVSRPSPYITIWDSPLGRRYTNTASPLILPLPEPITIPRSSEPLAHGFWLPDEAPPILASVDTPPKSQSSPEPPLVSDPANDPPPF